jgi:hypothetical protein
MLQCYCHYCGGWGVACHTTSPQRMIPPPIKRSRILVSGGVVIVISVKLYNKICGCDACGCNACGCAYPAGKFPCAGILRPKAKSGPERSQQNQLYSICGFSTSRIVREHDDGVYSHLQYRFRPICTQKDSKHRPLEPFYGADTVRGFCPSIVRLGKLLL